MCIRIRIRIRFDCLFYSIQFLFYNSCKSRIDFNINMINWMIRFYLFIFLTFFLLLNSFMCVFKKERKKNFDFSIFFLLNWNWIEIIIMSLLFYIVLYLMMIYNNIKKQKNTLDSPITLFFFVVVVFCCCFNFTWTRREREKKKYSGFLFPFPPFI